MVDCSDYKKDYSDTTISGEWMYRDFEDALDIWMEASIEALTNTLQRIVCILENWKNLWGNRWVLEDWYNNSTKDLRQLKEEGLDKFRKEYLWE